MLRCFCPRGLSLVCLLLQALLSLSSPMSTSTLRNTVPPVIVIVPEAWHVRPHYCFMMEALSNAGYRVVMLDLPSTAAQQPPLASPWHDANVIRQAILMSIFQAGGQVILVMHGYGAIPGSMAAKGMSVSERTDSGQPGGILGLVYVSGMLARDGESYLDKLPRGASTPWIVTQVSLLNARASRGHPLQTPRPDNCSLCRPLSQ